VEAYPFTHSRRENPSLEKAWAYFDHVALSRFVLETDAEKIKKRKKNWLHRCIRKCFCKGDKQLHRAEPGENHLPTVLYQPLFTPHKQLGDWGLGIGLYFSTLRAITFLTFLAGVLNTPNFIYFSQEDYSDGQEGISDLLQGSAICTRTVWVPCPDCSEGDFEGSRLVTGTNDVTGENATFALHNDCDGPTIEQGMVNYATLMLVMLGTIGLNIYLRRMEVAFDEDEQSAQDYSIVIENPPGDATDPEEWRKFFYDNYDGAQVTACTIAVDNDLLVRSLVERREKLRQIEMSVEPGTSLDTLTLARIAAKEERERRFVGQLLASVSPGIPELFARLVVLTAKVQGLAQQDYPASNVFITFETEAAQRRVLSALSVGSMDVARNKKTAVADPKYLFRGEKLLSVKEPDEPNTVRWQDLNEKFKERLKQQALTTLCTFIAIVAIAAIVQAVNNASVAFAAFAIAIFNSLFPMVAKFLTDLEAHYSEGGKQRSLYFKIALFRWANTAVVITIITPFTSTLSDGGLIDQIYALFIAEIVTTNAVQLLDPVGHFQRHFQAPREKTQDAMNLKMQGQVFELAERYTNMTKILFLTLWYCAIYPGAFFMCSFALLINYFVDRFSLMRSWKRPPLLGPKISEFSRRYFFSLAIVAMAVLSSYYWASFPFDNLCRNDGQGDTEFSGTWVLPVAGDPILELNETYRYCLQDFFRFDANERSFPFVSKNQREGERWMTDDQEIVADIYGWSAVGVLAIVVLSFLWGWYIAFRSLFRGTYESCGEDQNIAFSDVPSINGYVPQVVSAVFSYPLLACNIEHIDEELLEWTDPDRPHSFYDLTKDAEVLLRGMDLSSKVVFSQICHWPPEREKKKAK
jgi:hypothetical protein